MSDYFATLAEEVVEDFGFDGEGVAATVRILRRLATQGLDPAEHVRMAGHAAAAWCSYRRVHRRLRAGLDEHGAPLTEAARTDLERLVADQHQGARIMAAAFLIVPRGRDHLAPVGADGLDLELAAFFEG